MSSDAVCEIESVNDDGTLNVYLLPDKTNIIRKIINQLIEKNYLEEI